MISITKGNLVVFFGDDAVKHYVDVVNCWSSMVNENDWEKIKFLLVCDKDPDISKITPEAKKYTTEDYTILCDLNKAAPTKNEVASLGRQCVGASGEMTVHMVCCAGQSHLDYSWIRDFAKNAKEDNAHNVWAVYYMVFGADSQEWDQQQMVDTLQESSGPVFLLGDSNASGGSVKERDRWRAISLAMLLTSADMLQLENRAYSLGYSALNAAGNELEQLCQYQACKSISGFIDSDISSISDNSFRELVLPEGADSINGLEEYVAGVVKQYLHRFSSSTWTTFFNTIRFDRYIEEYEAAKRAERFTRLNMTESLQEDAKGCGLRLEGEITERMSRSMLTACFPIRLIDEIIQKLERITGDEITFPTVKPVKMPFIKTKAAVDECVKKRRAEIKKAVITFRENYARNVYAAEIAKAYERIKEWLLKITEGDESYNSDHGTAAHKLRIRQRELEKPESGNVRKLVTKYKDYSGSLEKLNPTVEQLSEKWHDKLFDENGKILDGNWDRFIENAGKNLRSSLPSQFRGSFYKVLQSEFDDPDSRKKFFLEYMSNGPRMFKNDITFASGEMSKYVIDEGFSDEWFDQRHDQTQKIEVKSDNAENLTVYLLGGERTEEYLKPRDNFDYYFTSTTGFFTGRKNTFAENSKQDYNTDTSRYAGSRHRFSEEKYEEEKLGDNNHGIALYPDSSGHYMLTWDWNSNHSRVFVEAIQDGARIGKIIDVTASEFHEGGRECVDFGQRVMGNGKVPFGKTGKIYITVTGDNDEEKPYIDMAEVKVWLNVVKYSLSGSGDLEITGSASSIDRFVLQGIDRDDGTQVFYPLYPSNDDGKYTYSKLGIADAKIVPDPLNPLNIAIAVEIDNNIPEGERN